MGFDACLSECYVKRGSDRVRFVEHYTLAEFRSPIVNSLNDVLNDICCSATFIVKSIPLSKDKLRQQKPRMRGMHETINFPYTLRRKNSLLHLVRAGLGLDEVNLSSMMRS